MNSPEAPPPTPGAEPMTKEPNPPMERGGCLSLFLLAMMTANAVLIVTLAMRVSSSHAPADAYFHNWALVALSGASALVLAASVALWRFKRWGLYLAWAVAPLAFLVNLSVGVHTPMAVMGLLCPIILTVLVMPLWKHMT